LQHSPPKVGTLSAMLFQRIYSLSICNPATGFSKAFPGIKPHLLTLTTNFQVPFYRDFLLALGICSVSKRSCSNILKSGPGNAITIVVGGAAESLSAHPGTADLTLRKRCAYQAFIPIYSANGPNRLGFIKVAIQHGYVEDCPLLPLTCSYIVCRADLVPVFSFGENDVSAFAHTPTGKFLNVV